MAYSIADDDAALPGSTHAAERLHRWPGTTRRGVQIALGVLWLLDAALQLQPFMFTADFARQVLAPSGQDQPVWVSAPTDFLRPPHRGAPSTAERRVRAGPARPGRRVPDPPSGSTRDRGVCGMGGRDLVVR